MRFCVLPAREVTLFQDQHMRSDPSATTDKVVVASHCLYVEGAGPNEDMNILVDSGADPRGKSPGHIVSTFDDVLLTNLRTMGIDPFHITHYIGTHLHWDHAGGIVNREGRLTLPNPDMTLVFGKRSFEEHKRGAPKNADEAKKSSFVLGLEGQLEKLRERGKLVLLEGTHDPFHTDGTIHELFGPGVHFYFSGGHSQDQMHPLFISPDGQWFVGGDLIPTAWHAQSSQRYMPAFDPKERRETLTMEVMLSLGLANIQKWRIVTYHDPAQGAVSVHKEDGAELYTVSQSFSTMTWF